MKYGLMSIFAACLLATTPSVSQTLSLIPGKPKLFRLDLHKDTRNLNITTRLRIPNTPEAIRTVKLRDQNGRAVQFRMLVDAQKGVILGTHLKGIKLELVRRSKAAGDLQYFVVGRDGQ